MENWDLALDVPKRPTLVKSDVSPHKPESSSVSLSPVTVLILNWNGRHWLEKFLPSVMASTYDAMEVLVADNGSTDDSLAFLAKEYPQIRTLPLDQNYGFTQGNNLALDHIDTPYLVLLNSDVEVTPGWLEPLVSIMDQQPDIAAVQPKIRAFNQKTHFEYAGAAGGYLDRFGYPFCRGRLFDITEEDQGQYDSQTEIFWATGACCFIRRSVIDEIGLFEPSFFAHMEEIDFCWRAKNFGYKIYCEPASTVFHVGGGTLPQHNPWKTYLNVRNSLAMMFKNFPASHLLPKLGIRLMLDGVWGIKSLIRGDFKTIGAIIRAHWAFFLKIPFWLKRRKEIYADNPPGRHRLGYFPDSIVWQYFARGKKTFSVLMKKYLRDNTH